MMKVRYAIERGFESEPYKQVFLVLVDENGEPVGGSGCGFSTEEEAKECAQASDAPLLKWKPAPDEWQPDTYLVTQYFNDEGWDNRG
jgi:hypothetical protein